MESIKKLINKIILFNKNFGKIFLLFLITIFSFYLINFYSKNIDKNILEVSFLNIGQGDSSLIKMPNGENILIDAGPDKSVVEKLENKFSMFGEDINYAILTHPDADHISGFYFLAKKYNIKNILENGDQNKNTGIYKNIEDEFQKENLKQEEIFVNCGDEINFKDFNKPRIFILHPTQNKLATNDTNENSIIILLIYGKYSFLFTGDMDKNNEKNIFNEIDQCFSNSEINIIKNNLKNLTVLKVAHHGSKSASGEEFIKTIKPEYSIISVGDHNKYGHPNQETVSTLERYSKNIFYTNKNGNINFYTDGENISFDTER